MLNLISSQRKQTHYIQTEKDKNDSRFLLGNYSVKETGKQYLYRRKKKSIYLAFYTPQKISLKNDGKIKNFSDIQELKQLLPAYPHNKNFKEVLQVEENNIRWKSGSPQRKGDNRNLQEQVCKITFYY